MTISKNCEQYSLNLESTGAIIESNDGHPLHVRKLIGGLEITYNGATYILQDGQIKAATIPTDGRTLPMEFLPGFQKLGGSRQVRQPETDFTQSWEDKVNAEIKGIWQALSDHKESTAARLDKLEKDANSLITPVHSAEVSQFSANGTVTLRLCMAGEEIEAFLAGHAVDFKRVPGGLNLILTPRRIWQVATRWADYCRERAALSVDESVVQTLGGSHQVRPAKEPEKGEDGKYGDRAMGEFLTFGEKYWILLKGEYGDVVKAIYNGDGEFLCKGLSVKASPRFKPQKA